MQHIIEIRQADLTESKIGRLNQFIENGRIEGKLLQRRQITPHIANNDVPSTIRGIMDIQWRDSASSEYSRYKAVVGNVDMQINILVDELGQRFVIVYAKRNDIPNTIVSIHVGYDSDLAGVSQMLAVTKIKTDVWRYCINN